MALSILVFWLHAEDYWSPCMNIVYGGLNRVKVGNLAHGHRYCFTEVAANKMEYLTLDK